MFNRVMSFCIPLAAISIGGCASLGSYTPVVDSGAASATKATEAALSTDLVECKALASSGEGYMVDGGKGLMIGGVMGAAMGASAGAVSAMAAGGTTMAAGAVAATGYGAILGIPVAAWAVYNEGEKREIGYRTCLRDRGHSVVR